MKYYVFSDVHGFYKEFIDELNKTDFDVSNENHMLISLGDNFDRGPNNYEMFHFLKEMKYKNKIILVKGNHEDLMLSMLTSRLVRTRDIYNGTFDTIAEFSNIYFDNTEMFFKGFENLYFRLEDDGFFDLIYDMYDYYETDNYIFTHGYVPVKIIEDSNKLKTYNILDNWRESNSEAFQDSRWLNGMMIADEENCYLDKMIVVGHWHCSYGNVRKKYGFELEYNRLKNLEFSEIDLFKPYYGEHVIGIDTCTVYTKKVNIICIED